MNKLCKGRTKYTDPLTGLIPGNINSVENKVVNLTRHLFNLTKYI
jgi:hypothetical protein